MFSLITIIFVACVITTITSFKEIPLKELQNQEEFRKMAENERIQESFDIEEDQGLEKNNFKKDNATYGSLIQSNVSSMDIYFFLT